jgi:hypothetical protein
MLHFILNNEIAHRFWDSVGGLITVVFESMLIPIKPRLINKLLIIVTCMKCVAVPDSQLYGHAHLCKQMQIVRKLGLVRNFAAFRKQLQIVRKLGWVRNFPAFCKHFMDMHICANKCRLS